MARPNRLISSARALAAVIDGSIGSAVTEASVKPGVGSSAGATHGVPSWSATATQPWSTPSSSSNPSGATRYQV